MITGLRGLGLKALIGIRRNYKVLKGFWMLGLGVLGVFTAYSRFALSGFGLQLGFRAMRWCTCFSIVGASLACENLCSYCNRRYARFCKLRFCKLQASTRS